MKSIFRNRKKIRTEGFILPITLVVCTIILTIATGISVVLTKELYFSKITKESQLAYYAADNAMMCATTIDDKYIDPSTGLGIFPYDPLISNWEDEVGDVLEKVNLNRQYRNLSTLILDDIKCATAPVFDSEISSFTASSFSRFNSEGGQEDGKKSSYSMRMNLGDGTFRCATIIIYKTPKYRQIIAKGYASCNPRGSQFIERAIVSTTEFE